jgi:hypothetical protein
MTRVLMAVWAMGLWSAQVHAAEVTEVADALMDDNPIDVRMAVPFVFDYQQAAILREGYQAPSDDPSGAPRPTLLNELEYRRVRVAMKPRLDIGIFHDLAFFTEWPIVLWDAQDTQYAEGTSEDNSTLTRDRNSTDPATTTINGWDGNGRVPNKEYTDWRGNADGTFNAYRRGVDNPRFGFRYAPINQERDETLPTIALQADYTAPFFAFMNPTTDTVQDAQNPGPVANGLHMFHGSVAMSRRIGLLDPYVLIEVNVPFSGTQGTYLAGLMDPFPRGMNGGFAIGTEVVPFEDKKQNQRVSFLVEANARYFSESRNYSAVSDLLKQITTVEQSALVGGRANIQYQAFGLLRFVLGGYAGYQTAHVLTAEEFGVDSNDDDNGEVNLADPNERNAYFNPALDAPGRRLVLDRNFQLGANLSVALTL